MSYSEHQQRRLDQRHQPLDRQPPTVAIANVTYWKQLPPGTLIQHRHSKRRAVVESSHEHGCGHRFRWIDGAKGELYQSLRVTEWAVVS